MFKKLVLFVLFSQLSCLAMADTGDTSSPSDDDVSSASFFVWNPIFLSGSDHSAFPKGRYLKVEKVEGHVKFYKCLGADCLWISDLVPAAYQKVVAELNDTWGQRRGWIWGSAAFVGLFGSAFATAIIGVQQPDYAPWLGISVGVIAGVGAGKLYSAMEKSDMERVTGVFSAEHLAQVPDGSMQILQLDRFFWSVIDTFACEPHLVPNQSPVSFSN